MWMWVRKHENKAVEGQYIREDALVGDILPKFYYHQTNTISSILLHLHIH